MFAIPSLLAALLGGRGRSTLAALAVGGLICTIMATAGALWWRDVKSEIREAAAQQCDLGRLEAELAAAKEAQRQAEVALAHRARAIAMNEKDIAYLEAEKEELRNATPGRDKIVVPQGDPWLAGRRPAAPARH